MTTPSAPALTPAAASVPARPVTPLRGLVRTNLRVHRWALSFWLLLVVVTAGALLWVYGNIDSILAILRSESCAGPMTDYCDAAWNNSQRYADALAFAQGVLQVLPALVGAWAGAALVGRELETGTAVLTWTQSVSPARWLAAKLAVPAVLLTAGSTVLVVLNRLVWDSGETARNYLGPSFWSDGTVFPALGPVAVFQTLFALAAGVLAGFLARRALPALGLGLVITGLMITVANKGRAHLWPVKYSVGDEFAGSADAWITDTGDLTVSGGHAPYNDHCHLMIDPAKESRCLAEHGLSGREWMAYHPGSHFWPLQLVETGVLVLATALVVYTCFVILRRRTA